MIDHTEVRYSLLLYIIHSWLNALYNTETKQTTPDFCIVICHIIIAYSQTYTALHEAVEHNKLNIIQLLVELGADITATDDVSDYCKSLL